MEKLAQFEQPSTAANVTVRRHGPVKGYRPREYLTEREIDGLMKAASGNRWGHRDATAILIPPLGPFKLQQRLTLTTALAL
jgi:hypothetical protein